MMRRRRNAERIDIPGEMRGPGMIGGDPDEIDVDPRGDGLFNIDSFYRAENLEHRLVVSRELLRELRAKIDQALAQ